MDNGRHRNLDPYVWRQLLPEQGINPYPRLVVDDESDMHRIRAPKALWDAYAAVVGERGRSADLREYMEWRVENPDTPLPGRWRGPLKRTGKRRQPKT